jgi:predicted N-formylglutamate amidohydrolase
MHLESERAAASSSQELAVPPPAAKSSPAVRLVVSCEHGGHRIPAFYRPLFEAGARQALLCSHFGYDIGALRLAREMAAAFGAPLFGATVSRLLIDLNRSPGHPHLYSAVTRSLAPAQRQQIFERYYQPYRSALQHQVMEMIGNGYRAVHISCHSFTPVLNGKTRRADIGLLYDPAHSAEAMLCQRWQRELSLRLPELAIRRNAPYKGVADGFTSALRRQLEPDRYCGIEIEINQIHVTRNGQAWHRLRRTVIEALQQVLASDPWP